MCAAAQPRLQSHSASSESNDLTTTLHPPCFLPIRKAPRRSSSCDSVLKLLRYGCMRFTLLLKAFRPLSGPKERRFRQIDDEYEITDRIDKDASMNTVRLGHHRQTGDRVAIKTVVKKSRSASDQEELVFRQMSHPSLVHLIDVFEDKKCTYFVMEHCTGGDLIDLIENCGGRLSQSDAITIFRQLVNAVCFMHSKNIVHCDLKPSNVMVSGPNLLVKLIDFGASRVAVGSSQVQITQGSPEFMAPEVIERCQLDFKSDIWSLGIILFIMVIGYSPFNPLGKPYCEIHGSLQRRLRSGFQPTTKPGFGSFFPESTPCSQEVKSLIAWLLSYDPKDRPTASELLCHPLLRNALPKGIHSAPAS